VAVRQFLISAFIISTMGQTHGTRMWVIAALSFSLSYIRSSGSIGETTGYSYGDGSTYSPTEMLSISYK
jgi:hypothetical protein